MENEKKEIIIKSLENPQANSELQSEVLLPIDHKELPIDEQAKILNPEEILENPLATLDTKPIDPTDNISQSLQPDIISKDEVLEEELVHKPINNTGDANSIIESFQ